MLTPGLKARPTPSGCLSRVVAHVVADVGRGFSPGVRRAPSVSWPSTAHVKSTSSGDGAASWTPPTACRGPACGSAGIRSSGWCRGSATWRRRRFRRWSCTGAFRLGVPRVVLIRMVLNILIDLIAGTVPFVGDLFDVAWQSNSMNFALLERHEQAGVKPTSADWAVVLLAFVVVGGAVMLVVLSAAWMVYVILRPFLRVDIDIDNRLDPDRMRVSRLRQSPAGTDRAGPACRAGTSRLLVLDRATGATTPRHVRELPRWLHAGDLLVVNDTRVFPARLLGPACQAGALECLLARGAGGRHVGCPRASGAAAEARAPVCARAAALSTARSSPRLRPPHGAPAGRASRRRAIEASVTCRCRRTSARRTPPRIASATRRCSRAAGIGGRADGGAALHRRRCSRRRGARRRDVTHHAARRLRHVQAGARRARSRSTWSIRSGTRSAPRRPTRHQRARRRAAGASSPSARRRRGRSRRGVAGDGRGRGRARRIAPLHPSRAPVPRGRRADDELPPARGRRC